ncbi:MAG: hypothetical protein H7Y00_14165 [Fimbriimonadaceae bacterium]|nr:hypothetical protein [Chitinophagales bacterium]
MKLIPAILIIMFSASALFAQTETSNSDGSGKAVTINKNTGTKSKGLVYDTELSFGLKTSNAGWGIFSDLTKHITYEKERLYYFEINFLKHPKELKKVNEYTIAIPYDSPKPFVYGKKNSFFAAKAGYGNKFLLGQKAEKNGFEINFDYVVGPSLGFVKPYYLDVWYEEDGSGNIIPEKYSDSTASYFLDATSIYGYSGFTKGFSEISIIPGAFGKAGINFDWATYDDFVKALEVGIGGEFYIKDIPMMIVENNKPYFVYLYLTLQFGKKW